MSPALPAPPRPPDPLLVGVIDLVTDKLVLKPLLDKAPAEYRDLLELYVPAVRRMAEDELFALAQKATSPDPDGALDLVRAKMPPEELVREKRELLKLTIGMAKSAAAALERRRAMTRATVFAALKLAMLVAA